MFQRIRRRSGRAAASFWSASDLRGIEKSECIILAHHIEYTYVYIHLHDNLAYNTHIQYIYIYMLYIYTYLHDHINISWLNYVKSPIYGRFFSMEHLPQPDLVGTLDPANSWKAALQKHLSRGIGFLRGFITMGNYGKHMGKHMGKSIRLAR